MLQKFDTVPNFRVKCMMYSNNIGIRVMGGREGVRISFLIFTAYTFQCAFFDCTYGATQVQRWTHSHELICS